ncbi:hypothetical protein BGZ92_003952 [Podila epicladia]|nr:hypothetical protein BGZ92_003952 [Podila epicladia]
MQRREDQVQQQQQQPLSSSLPNKTISDRHDAGPLSDFNPLQPQQQPSFQSNRPTLTPVPYDSGNIESPDLPPTGRKPSLVEGILTTAASAASTAVEAARNLVSHEDILEKEAKDPSSSSKATSSSLFPSLGSESHHGLEFKQRRLSVDRSKRQTPPPAHTHGDAASSAANAVTQWLEATKAENAIQREKEAALCAKDNVDSMDNLAPVWPLSDGGADSGNAAGDIQAKPVQGANINANANSVTGDIKPNANANNIIDAAGIGVGLSPGTGSGSGSGAGSNINSNGANANTAQTSGIPPREGNPSTPATTNPARSNSQSSSIRHNTIYVAGQGPESVRHGSMGVDKPAVSSSYQHHHRNSSSGMGVDQPLLVGQPRDPKEHRKGGLQVDTKHPDDTHHHEVHLPHDHKEEEAKAAAEAATGAASGTSPLTGHGSISRKGRRGSFSGLNVDPAPAPSKQHAGHGSNEATHRSGSYNSGINVDKAGSGDHKRSGMGVDGPALSSYHMASTNDPHLLVSGHGGDDNRINNNVGTEQQESVAHALCTGSDDGSFVEARGSGFGEGGTIQVNRYATSSQAPLTTTTASTTTNHNLQVGSSSHMPRTTDNIAGHIVTDVPADYHGPLPQVAPGEQVVWVKKVTQTDYYGGSEKGSENPPQKRSSMGSFLDRLRRKSTGNSNNNTVDKGKQRQ